MTFLEKKSQIISSEEARDWLIQYFMGDVPIITDGWAPVEVTDHLLASAWSAGFKLAPLDEHDIAMGETL